MWLQKSSGHCSAGGVEAGPLELMGRRGRRGDGGGEEEGSSLGGVGGEKGRQKKGGSS